MPGSNRFDATTASFNREINVVGRSMDRAKLAQIVSAFILIWNRLIFSINAISGSLFTRKNRKNNYLSNFSSRAGIGHRGGRQGVDLSRDLTLWQKLSIFSPEVSAYIFARDSSHFATPDRGIT